MKADPNHDRPTPTGTDTWLGNPHVTGDLTNRAGLGSAIRRSSEHAKMGGCLAFECGKTNSEFGQTLTAVSERGCDGRHEWRG
jgi:hypothetical protein